MSGIISPHADLSIIIDTELLIRTSAGKLQPISQTAPSLFFPTTRHSFQKTKVDESRAVLYILEIPVFLPAKEIYWGVGGAD